MEDIFLTELINLQIYTLTDTEKSLLISAFGNENDVNEGRLFEYQENVLRQIRVAVDYLSRKYGDTRFEYRSFLPITKLNDVGKIAFSANGSEAVYYLYYTEEDEGFRCTDNYYQVYYLDSFSSLVASALSNAGFEACAVCDFITALPEDADYEAPLADFLSSYPGINKTIYLFVKNGISEKDKENIHSALSAEKLYGFYIVFNVPGEEWSAPGELLEKKDKWEHTVINCELKKNAEVN